MMCETIDTGKTFRDSQVILTQTLTNERTGGQHLIPLVEQIEAKTEDVVEEVSGIAESLSKQRGATEKETIRGYVAAGRRTKTGPGMGVLVAGDRTCARTTQPRRKTATVSPACTYSGTGLRHHQKRARIPSILLRVLLRGIQ